MIEQTKSVVIFAALISSLSWATLSNSHWSGPALWYAGIVLSLTALVLGAQQSIALPSEADTDGACNIQQRLRSDGKATTPRQDMLFIQQSPLMCLSWAVFCFLAGLTSVVVSPLARHPVWGIEAKVRISRIFHLKVIRER
jgi:hypothetical protein